ncbi:MAG TPA: hypothetical protein VGX76_07185 [Pirellulales bacterium]|jgi:hypothetical protein|nr:hypothetical protein [Pirellulales bacterium]
MSRARCPSSQATFEFLVNYDPAKTTLADLERGLDQLLREASATPDILDECGNPEVGAVRLSAPDPEARIVEVLRSDDLDCGGTVKNLLARGGRLIDKTLSNPPKAVFRLDDEDGWWQASIELNVYPADPSDVRDLRDELSDERNAEEH